MKKNQHLPCRIGFPNHIVKEQYMRLSLRQRRLAQASALERAARGSDDYEPWGYYIDGIDVESARLK